MAGHPQHQIRPSSMMLGVVRSTISAEFDRVEAMDFCEIDRIMPQGRMLRWPGIVPWQIAFTFSQYCIAEPLRVGYLSDRGSFR
mmetsp:Transcript_94310/g.148359  ORF Transcript_94310/g.148359 Transcript_94310/m.148359 type:complete len:84 (+) Transcript_94310:398-649(+)